MELVRLIGEVEVLQERLGLTGSRSERLRDLKAGGFERLGRALAASRGERRAG